MARMGLEQSPNYPAISDIVRTMVDVFNREVKALNIYSDQELAYYPICEADLFAKNAGIRGRMPRIIDECRLLSLYVIAKHTQGWDQLARRHRFLKYSEIGMAFNRKTGTIKTSMSASCRILSQSEHRHLLEACLRHLKEAGFILWNEPRSLSSNPCEPG